MTTMYGADANALEALASRMRGDAAELDRIRVTLRSRLHSSPWRGPNADRFRQEWDGPHTARLVGAANAMRTAAERLARNASEQRSASRPTVGGSVSSFGALAALGGIAAAPVSQGLSDLFLYELFPSLLDIADITEVFTGGAGTLLGVGLGGFNVATGLIDAVYDHPYEGNFDKAETVADGLKTLSGGLAIAAVATGGPTNPVGAVFTGLSLISYGVSYGIDLGLDNWNDWGRDAYRSAAPVVDQLWDGAFEAGRGVVGDAAESVGSVLGSGWKKLGGLF